MKYLLRDIDGQLVSAWSTQFAGTEDVEISEGDIFGARADALVSPANSFGFMDGGIDLVYSKRFGWDLQDRLQELLRAEHDGELPVGQAVIVPTYDEEIPLLVCAPTMRIPMDVSETVNAYLAFRATIRAVRSYNRTTSTKIESVLCPGLCTAVGRMPAKVCARQMHAAYVTSHLGQVLSPLSLGQAKDIHFSML